MNKQPNINYFNHKTMKVLLIEDDPDYFRLIQEMMAEARNSVFDLEGADRLETGLKYLAEREYDVILLDLGLPESHGLETFTRVQSEFLHIPIVVLTGNIDEEQGTKAVQLGAQDYLIKGEVESNLLVRVLHYSIERKKAEEQIKSSLRANKVLLKEIYHRAKNNMQVIFSLLNLQSRHIKDKKVLDIFKETQARIRSMALVHEKLYQSKDLSKIEVAPYIKSLTVHLFHSYQISANVVRLRTDIEDVFLDIKTAVPCGLIINELVSNSLKHAFPKGKSWGEGSESKGEIRITFRQNEEGQLELVVRDTGAGFPKDLDFRKTESLGLQLVNNLVSQLRGSIELQRRGGTTFRITFNAPK